MSEFMAWFLLCPFESNDWKPMNGILILLDGHRLKVAILQLCRVHSHLRLQLYLLYLAFKTILSWLPTFIRLTSSNNYLYRKPVKSGTKNAWKAAIDGVTVVCTGNLRTITVASIRWYHWQCFLVTTDDTVCAPSSLIITHYWSVCVVTVRSIRRDWVASTDSGQRCESCRDRVSSVSPAQARISDGSFYLYSLLSQHTGWKKDHLYLSSCSLQTESQRDTKLVFSPAHSTLLLAIVWEKELVLDRPSLWSQWENAFYLSQWSLLWVRWRSLRCFMCLMSKVQCLTTATLDTSD